MTLCQVPPVVNPEGELWYGWRLEFILVETRGTVNCWMIPIL